jgi:alpha,alpha-trehalase
MLFLMTFKRYVLISDKCSRDAPNSWPPHQYIILQALRALPANVSGVSLSSLTRNRSTFDIIPAGQLGILETDLPGQPIRFSGTRNATTSGIEADINGLNGTVSNGGSSMEGEGWAQTLQREVANRFIATAFCSWCVTQIWCHETCN